MQLEALSARRSYGATLTDGSLLPDDGHPCLGRESAGFCDLFCTGSQLRPSKSTEPVVQRTASGSNPCYGWSPLSSHTSCAHSFPHHFSKSGGKLPEGNNKKLETAWAVAARVKLAASLAGALAYFTKFMA